MMGQQVREDLEATWTRYVALQQNKLKMSNDEIRKLREQ